MAKKTKALAKSGENFFTEYGKVAGQQSSIVGNLLKFSKGEYLFGQDQVELKLGTKLIANMDSILTGWYRWEDQRPAEQLMGPLVEGFQPAKRDELGYEDRKEWEKGTDGNVMDPWQFTNTILLKTPGKNGDLFTFNASSKGAIGAIGKMCTAYGKDMRERPNEYPIIKLGFGSYMHSNKAFGKIKFPEFEIVGWASKKEFDDVMKADEPAARAAARDKPAKASGGVKRLTSRA